MPFVEARDGARVYYEVHGSGPAVLFVHGSGGHHMAWWQQVSALRQTYTTVTVDLRGFGRSSSSTTGGPLDARLFVDDITAVLDEVAAQGVTRAVLVGQSIGAAAALKAALRTPARVAGVVLAHSLGGVDHPELAALVKADRAAAETMPVLDRLLSPAFQRERPDKAFLFQQMGTFNTAKMADLTNLTSDGPRPDDLAAAGFPILLLAGELDAVLSATTVRKAGELLPGVAVDVVPEGPHSMYFERPDLFNAALVRFLGSVYAEVTA
ncbi:MAG TPA: alpha/beta hydrolase [Actinomycetes bacterium]|nr:alpha/beta hydrolase [Actinomycetes bacterium]